LKYPLQFLIFEVLGSVTVMLTFVSEALDFKTT